MTSPKIPKELEGIAHYTYEGNLVYTTCIECGVKKKRSGKAPRCKPCGTKIGAAKREQTDKWNPREGFRICKTCEIEKPLNEEHFYWSNHPRCPAFRGSCKECKKAAERAKKGRKRKKPTPEANKRQYERRRSTPEGRLRHNVSGCIRAALTSNQGGKLGGSILDHLPYSIAELKEHLERQFEAGMSWENWGKGADKWNIDHIYPHSKLPYDSMAHPNFQKAWALSNLRPLWELENLAKGDKIIKELFTERLQ